MKASSLKLLLLLLLVATATAAPPASRVLQLDDGMPLIVTPTVDLSSAVDDTGEQVTFTLVQDCKVDGVVLLSKGTIVNGAIENAVHSKMFGKPGTLEVSFANTTAVDGSPLTVRATVDRKGNIPKDTMDKVVSILPYGVGMVFNGKDAILPAGAPLTIFIDGTYKFKIVSGKTPALIGTIPSTQLP